MFSAARWSMIGLWAAGIMALAAPSAAATACSVTALVELPVTMSGAQPLIHGKIDGQEAQLLVDSGAFYGLMTEPKSRQFGLKLYPAPNALRVEGVGGDTDLMAATVKTLTIGGQTFPKVMFLVGGNNGGDGVDASVGQNLLRAGDVEYDLGHGIIRIFKAEGCDNDPMAYWAGAQPYSMIVSEWQNDDQVFTIGPVFVNGKRLRAMFDSGSSRSMLSKPAAEKLGIDLKGSGVKEAGLSSGVGRKLVRTWTAPIASFKIGGEEIRNTRLVVGDTDLGDTDMLLGADFFLSHHIYASRVQHRIYFTYNGGPVFRLDEPAAGAPAPAAAGQEAAPVTAAGFARRGAARASRRSYAEALADYDQAVKLAPDQPGYLYQRAQVRVALNKAAGAVEDLDLAIRLKPDFLAAELLRADLKLEAGDDKAALVDLEAVDRQAAKVADERLELAEDYLRLDHLEPGIANLDLWIAAAPDDSRRPRALVERCRADALLGETPEKAAADCAIALKERPISSFANFGQGLLRLRAGDFAGAIARFDIAIKSDPKNAWALYARGLAERALGRAAAGDSDVAAALALDKGLTDEARRRGIAASPPAPVGH